MKLPITVGLYKNMPNWRPSVIPVRVVKVTRQFEQSNLHHTLPCE